MTDGFAPNGFIIGAQRTGTTNLAFMLNQHPDVVVSEPKEPVFFTRNYDRGFDWYEQRFPDRSAKVLVDASTWYSVAPTQAFPEPRGKADEPLVGVPQKIFQVRPDARFIYIVREPATRCHSMYWMLRRMAPADFPHQSFREAIETDPFYLRSCDYIGQLENFFACFHREQFLVLVFEEVVNDLPAALRRCTDFLGLSPHTGSLRRSGRHENASYRFTSPADLITRLLGRSDLLERVRRGQTKYFGKAAGKALDFLLVRPLPALGSEDRRYVRDSLAGQTARLEEFLGRPLSAWR